MTQFILMLTHDDETIGDALAIYAGLRDLDLTWVGFKDVGLPFDGLRELAAAIRSDGRKLALEVVSLDVESEIRSVKAGLEIGVDLLMGGVHPDAVLPLMANSNVMYFPFPGRVVDHPSILEGNVDDIVMSARELSSRRGVHGLDLLAYRFDGNVPDLMAGVVSAAAGPVVIAGSIDSAEKVEAVKRVGAWAFTVGSAVFDGQFPTAANERDQVRFVLDLL